MLVSRTTELTSVEVLELMNHLGLIPVFTSGSPSEWSIFEGKCYLFVNRTMNWEDARNNCHDLQVSSVLNSSSVEKYSTARNNK